MDLVDSLSEDELAIFDLLKKDALGKAERERVKQASRDLLQELRRILHGIDHWTGKESTRAEVETAILDYAFENLPDEEYSAEEKEAVAAEVFNHVWQQSGSGLA